MNENFMSYQVKYYRIIQVIYFQKLLLVIVILKTFETKSIILILLFQIFGAGRYLLRINKL